MSLRIIKAGVFDTIQDAGRPGYQYLGINPGGLMDTFSGNLANALLGNELGAPLLELHYPASQVLFEKANLISICGADFSASINGQPIPLNHPVAVNKNTLLKFTGLKWGARAYLACLHGLEVKAWLNSASTNLKASVGGLEGRVLCSGDLLEFSGKPFVNKLLNGKDFSILPWKALNKVDSRNEMEILMGSEWHWLDAESQEAMFNNWFQITNEADRMGYRVAGPKMALKVDEQLVSSAVSFGTIQILPNGQLTILMADHGTTGGYPRIGHVISAHLPILAQKKPNDVIRFKLTNLEQAEVKMAGQHKYLVQIQEACQLRLEELLGE